MIDFASIRAENPIAEVVGRYVELHRAGTEYRGLCPFHADRSPSLYVNPRKEKAFCMACHWAGDAVDFVAEIESVDLAEAARKLGAKDMPRDRPALVPLPPDLTESWFPMTVVPDDAPPYNPAQTYNPKRGRAVRYQPVRTWEYRNEAGQLMGYVLRLEFDGQKITPTITYCIGPGGERRWCTRPFAPKRPMYGLDRLAARPTAPVVVVEGEKAADAAQKALPRMVVVTWPGGTNGVRYADLKPLDGRDLVLWPDADEVGIDAMRTIARMVKPKSLRWINTEGLDKGADAADVTGDMVAFCKERVTSEPPSEVQPAAQEGESARQGEEPSETLGGTAAVVESAIVTIEPATSTIQVMPRVRADLDATVSRDDNLPAKYSEDNVSIAFAQQAESMFRFVPKMGRWRIWDGSRWQEDETGVHLENVRVMCRAVCDLIRRDGTEFNTEAKQNRAIAKYGERRTIANIEALARTDRRLVVRTDQWDADPWMLNTPGGVVDLRTGALREASQADYMTKITAVAPAGDCPTWLRFLETATDGDAELIGFLQRMAGYCLTGSTRDHALFFVYGTGGNGKGTFLNTLQWIMGDYSKSAPADMFTERKNDAHTTELARLMGARLVAAQETEEGKRWAEAKIKALTGGDPVTARFMRQDDFEFIPQFKLVMTGNHKPGLRNVDEAIKRRLHLIPFTVTIPAEKRDTGLADKLRAEAGGILQWAIEGCQQWVSGGLRPPAAVLAATSEYLEQQDAIGIWLEECCDIHSHWTAKSSALYASYKAHAERSGEFALPMKRWVAAMEGKGFTSKKEKAGMIYHGIKVKPDDDGFGERF